MRRDRKPAPSGWRRVGSVLLVVVATVLVSASACARSAPELVEDAAHALPGARSSLKDLSGLDRQLDAIPPAELDAAARARRDQVRNDVDLALRDLEAQELDAWAGASRQTAADAAVDAREDVVVSDPSDEFLADLREQAEETVKDEVCDQLTDLLYPTTHEPAAPDELASEILSALSDIYGRTAVGPLVKWAEWGYQASGRVDRIMTSLNDYPERIELLGQPPVLRAALAKERFCDAPPSAGG